MKNQEIKVLDNGTFQRAKENGENVTYEVRHCIQKLPDGFIASEKISVIILGPDGLGIEGRFGVNSFKNILEDLLAELKASVANAEI